MKRIIQMILLTACVALSACTSYRPLFPRSDHPPVKQPPRADSRPKPSEREPAAQTFPATNPPEVQARKTSTTGNAPEAKAPPAVIALLDAAETERQSGQLDAAAATLERAIRIQPRSARLWHQMALVRLEQEKPRLALDLARKSDTLASGDPALKRKNARIIEEAKRLLGDLEGAVEAH
ncbi:MAG: tetratricopeptide repeat protein [Methylococcales bacterium]